MLVFPNRRLATAKRRARGLYERSRTLDSGPRLRSEPRLHPDSLVEQ